MSIADKLLLSALYERLKDMTDRHVRTLRDASGGQMNPENFHFIASARAVLARAERETQS